ncbi:unnamed protein product [Urochloa humidicola]
MGLSEGVAQSKRRKAAARLDDAVADEQRHARSSVPLQASTASPRSGGGGRGIGRLRVRLDPGAAQARGLQWKLLEDRGTVSCKLVDGK